MEFSEHAAVETRDMAGRMVKQVRLHQGTNTIAVQELRKGVYHVIARTEDWTRMEKLVVN